ncbi:MAG: nucleotide exchange factor GrpE [bacterium]
MSEQERELPPEQGEGDAAGSEEEGLAAMRERVAELEDRLLRTAAEFENYKKRRARTDQDRVRFAAEPLVRDLLPVMDSFERAVEASEGTRDYQAFHDGVEMILQQLREVLERHGVERMAPEGEPFDPNLHEAMGMMPHEELEEDRVAAVLEPGYVLNERVIRPAKVMVSSGSPDREERGGDGD